jgi:hypothetical protein
VPPDALDRLEAVTRDLNAYLERRAREIAEPIVKAAQEAADAEIRATGERARRAGDLVDELRRHIRAYEDQLDDLRVKHGERRDPFVVERRGERHPPAASRRLAVNASQEAVDAIQLVMDNEGETLAQAHSRLIEYGALVYREARLKKYQVVVRGGGYDREVLLA